MPPRRKRFKMNITKDKSQIQSKIFQPREDAVLIAFAFHGRPLLILEWDGISDPRPSQLIVDAAPECIKRTMTSRDPVISISSNKATNSEVVHLHCDANYSEPLRFKPSELDDLISWLDDFFGSWRTDKAQTSTSGPVFRFEDYTMAELDLHDKKAKFWDSLNDHVANERY